MGQKKKSAAGEGPTVEDHYLYQNNPLNLFAGAGFFLPVSSP
ncbi:MAG: hypothetical protein ACO1NZ_14675 [Adhaeribacter sp.]